MLLDKLNLFVDGGDAIDIKILEQRVNLFLGVVVLSDKKLGSSNLSVGVSHCFCEVSCTLCLSVKKVLLQLSNLLCVLVDRSLQVIDNRLDILYLCLKSFDGCGVGLNCGLQVFDG